ncbi:MAG: glycoside hydrolase family 15 protein [Salinirussus sp.]
MRLTTALNGYKRRGDDRFPEESRTVDGAFSGDGDRLVHVSPAGSLRDYSTPLSGLNGLDRSRLAVETPRGTYWFGDLNVIRQHHYRETSLVETEFDANGFTVHQFDLTLGRAHVTHVELRGEVPARARLIAFLTLAPEGREAGVGALIHGTGGPGDSRALEVYHRREHDYVTASTGLEDVRGQQPERFEEILDDDPVSFPRGGAEPYDETRLSGDFVVAAPLEREGRGARTTLVTQLSDHGEADRETALSDLRTCALRHDSAGRLREAALERTAVDVPEEVSRSSLVRADLRALALLEGPSGTHVAAPEFDPFYANSGGYGYVWFRDDANVSRRLLHAADCLGIDVEKDFAATARFYCETQLADGTWPHRVWASDGSLAPGWANANVERTADSSEYQADQTAAATAFLATLLEERAGDLPPPVATDVRGAIDDAVGAMRASLDDGLPEPCQNLWENAVGQFTHTAATYLDAFAVVARAPVPDGVADRARAGAEAVLAGLDRLWDPDRELYPMAADDDRLDAATLALVRGACSYAAAVGRLDATTLDRLTAHLRSTLNTLFRNPSSSPVAGLIRHEGDRWRTADQVDPKVWSVTTGMAAVSTARFAGLLEAHGRDGDAFRDRAGDLYELLGADGPFATDTGSLAEQVFDDGSLDSATPLGWSHALRLHATALLDDLDALPTPTDEPTGPTERARWTTGEKYGLCTAADHEATDPSRVWFTLTEGALTEARFPRIDVMNVRTLDYLIRCPADGYTVRTHTERGDRTDTIDRRVEPVADDSLQYRHVFSEDGDSRGHAWSLSVAYATDPDHDALVAAVDFEAEDDREYEVFAVADTALANTGTRDRGLRVGETGNYNLLARDPTAYTGETDDPLLVDESGDGYSVAMALAAADRFDWATVGVAGSDRVTALFAGEDLPAARSSVDDESLVLVGRLGTGSSVTGTLAAGFARRANAAAALGEANGALERGFERVRTAYADTWCEALDATTVPDAVADDDGLAAQYRTALMSLLAVEDKTYHGASIASPSVPWGGAVTADEAKGYGYNFVWSRDLYQVFTVFLAVGFHDLAVEQLEYIYEYQQDERGFIPQNTYVNGITRWGGEQMDNISFPAVMAYQLWAAGVDVAEAGYDYEHVRRSADYVVRNGPATAQERWEEEAGYSPSSIAAEVAGLACAGKLAVEAGATGDALVWLALADRWAEGVDDWTATETGTERHDETPYYVRISRDGDPDAGHLRTLANDGPTLDERDIIDAGFLELVRLGIKPASDPVVRNSLAEVDATIRVDAEPAAAFYRYNGDGYGERATGDKGGPWSVEYSGKGRLWPLLTGERGEYELLAEDAGAGDDALTATDCLRAMAGFANSGRMIAEQVWDREHGTDYGWTFGEGTGSATPLAWSMAQYVRLAHGIDAGAPVETPAFVARRYRASERTDPNGPPGPELRVEARFQGEDVVVSGESTGALIAVKTAVDTTVIEPAGGTFEARVGAEPGGNEVAVAAATTRDVETAGTTVRRLSL